MFGVLFALLLLACYLPYIQFDTWAYLRFLLPAFPLLIVMTVVVFRRSVEGGGVSRVRFFFDLDCRPRDERRKVLCADLDGRSRRRA